MNKSYPQGFGTKILFTQTPFSGPNPRVPGRDSCDGPPFPHRTGFLIFTVPILRGRGRSWEWGPVTIVLREQGLWLQSL